MTRHTLSLDGRTVSYLDEGHGAPALVFVHGFPFAAEQWRTQIDSFAVRHRVVAPDLFGFGQSEIFGDRGRYSIPAYADQVAGLIEALDLGPVVLTGLSMGGYIALDLVARRPGLVSALVLADTRSEADSPDAARRRSDQQVFLAGNGDPATLAGGLVEAVIGPQTAGRDGVVEAVRAMMLANDRQGWIGALEAMRTRADVTGTLGAIAVPTLVVVGEDDTLTPPAAAEALVAGIPGAHLEVVPAAGHVSNLENPAEFNRVLGAFLAAL